VATKCLGAPEVEHVCTRALDLCQQVGYTPQLFPALWGLWLFYGSRGSVHTPQELATRLLRLAQSVQDPAPLLERYHAHRALAHPFSLAEALGYATWLAQFRREDGTVRTQAEVLMALAQEHGFAYWLAQGQMLWGWARAMQGHGEEGIAHIHQGLGAFQATA